MQPSAASSAGGQCAWLCRCACAGEKGKSECLSLDLSLSVAAAERRTHTCVHVFVREWPIDSLYRPSGTHTHACVLRCPGDLLGRGWPVRGVRCASACRLVERLSDHFRWDGWMLIRRAPRASSALAGSGVWASHCSAKIVPARRVSSAVSRKCGRARQRRRVVAGLAARARMAARPLPGRQYWPPGMRAVCAPARVLCSAS